MVGIVLWRHRVVDAHRRHRAVERRRDEHVVERRMLAHAVVDAVALRMVPPIGISLGSW